MSKIEQEILKVIDNSEYEVYNIDSYNSRYLKNLSNQSFGKWTTTKYFIKIGKLVKWLCYCECGRTIKFIQRNNLVSGKSIKCRLCADEGNKGYRLTNDLTGKTFNQLLVIKRVIPIRNDGSVRYECLCSCGTSQDYDYSDIVRGGITCCSKCSYDKRNYLKMSRTKFHNSWRGMKERCLNVNHMSYSRYGGRGITICDKWLEFEGFMGDMYESYLKHCEDFGEDNTSIDRIDYNGNYELNNCRWATYEEQANNKSNNIIVKINNETGCLIQMLRELELDMSRYYYLRKKTENIELALNTIVNEKYPNYKCEFLKEA